MIRPTRKFDRELLDAVFKELESSYSGSPEYERLLRDVHLGVALSDSGRELDESLDQRAASLVAEYAQE